MLTNEMVAYLLFLDDMAPCDDLDWRGDHLRATKFLPENGCSVAIKVSKPAMDYLRRNGYIDEIDMATLKAERYMRERAKDLNNWFK